MINESVRHVMGELGIERPINELFLQGNRRNPRFWAAMGDTVWLEGNKGKLADKVIKHMEKKTGVQVDGDSLEEIVQFTDALEERPEILFGAVDPEDDTLAVWTGRGHGIDSDIRHNVLAHKVARALKKKYIKKTRWGDTIDMAPVKKEHTLPDRAYHGTSLKALRRILKIGLRAQDHGKGNYPGVEHQQHVFFTTNLKKAQDHAMHAARQADSIPFIVEIKIPDKNALRADYDVDTMADQSEEDWDHIRAQHQFNSDMAKGVIKQKGFGASRDTGVYGYRGAVPPSHIISVYIPDSQESSESYQDFTGYPLEVVKDAMNDIEELGLEDMLSELPEDMDERIEMGKQLMDEYWRDEVRSEQGDEDEDY